MSDLSQFLHGQLSPQEFVTKCAADIQKDLAIFGPLAPEFETFAVDGIAWLIERSGKVSPTIVEAIKGQILKLLLPPQSS